MEGRSQEVRHKYERPEGQSIFHMYLPGDRESCLELFDANCPPYFAPNERTDYLKFLDAIPPFYRICLVQDRIVGAFGLSILKDGQGRLHWIMLAPEIQGHGFGSKIMDHILNQARINCLRRIDIAASHLSAPFFTHSGARTICETAHGWGPGMHRVDVQLEVRRPPADPH